jgi:hypothetical protein
MPAGTRSVSIGTPFSRSHHDTPTVGCAANGISSDGVWMVACATVEPALGISTNIVSL